MSIRIMLLFQLCCFTYFQEAKACKWSLTNQLDNLDQTKLELSIVHARRYINNNTTKNGRFNYEKSTNPSVEIKPNYNVLRHCGTIYALRMLANHKPSLELNQLIKKTVQYARENFLDKVGDGKELMVMWSNPEVETYLQSRQAKLGGAGLGIMALSASYTCHQNPVLLTEMKCLGNFILFMQREDGSFYSKYIPEEGGRNDEFKSLYYPGEAILGLTELYQYDQQEQWLDAAIKGIAFLANKRKGSTEVPGDHWALIASGRLMNLKRVKEDLKLSDLIINHAIQICRSMMSEQIMDDSNQAVHGAFRYYGPTANAATAMEGMLAAISFLPDKSQLKQEMEISIDAGIQFLINAQIKEGELKGGFPYATGMIEGNRKEKRKFQKEKNNVRIDYVQHALSAMVQYYNYKYPKP